LQKKIFEICGIYFPSKRGSSKALEIIERGPKKGKRGFFNKRPQGKRLFKEEKI